MPRRSAAAAPTPRTGHGTPRGRAAGSALPGSGTRLPPFEPVAAAQPNLAPRLPVVGLQRPQHDPGTDQLVHALAAIASRVAGSSRPDRSPGASPVTTARIARRSTLALRVFGSAVVNRTSAGLNDGPSASVTQREISARNESSAVHAGRRHDEHPQRLALQLVGDADRRRFDARSGARPRPSRPRPGRAACPASLIVSSERPCRNHCPSSETLAKSPCHHTSGHRDQ